MNTYSVQLTDIAAAEMEAIYLSLSQRLGPDSSARIYDALRSAIFDGLSYMPGRCALSEDGRRAYPDVVVRQVLYGRGRLIYRIYYHVLEPVADETEGIVRVLRVRHAAMRPLGETASDE